MPRNEKMVSTTNRISKSALSMHNNNRFVKNLCSPPGNMIKTSSVMHASRIRTPLQIRTKSAESIYDNSMNSKIINNPVLEISSDRIQQNFNRNQNKKKKSLRQIERVSFSKKHNTGIVCAENVDQVTHALIYEENWIEDLSKILKVDEIQSKSVSIPLLTIQYWLAQESSKGVENAVQILQKMVDIKSEIIQNNSNDESYSIHLSSLTTTILNLVINSGRKYGGDSFIKQASKLLESTDQLDKNTKQYVRGTKSQTHPKNFLRPNKKTYNMMIDLISKSTDVEEAAEDITRILSRMNNPDTYSFNSLLYAWSQRKNSNAAEKCEEFLRLMQNKIHVTRENEGKDTCATNLIYPDTVTYNTVINAWSQSRDPEAAIRAESLLYEMQHLYENGNNHVKPNQVTFTSVISAWAKSESIDAAYKAREIFDIMQALYEAGNNTMKPNTIAYNCLMNAYAKSVMPGTAEKAEEILQEMIKLYLDGDEDMKPDRISFTTCINAWCRSDENDSSIRAQGILTLMEELSRNNGMTKISPDIVTYNLVLKCLVSDTVEDKALQADVIIEKMNERRIKADIMAYNSVIQCCCTTRSEKEILRSDALRIANETLLKISRSKYVEPNPFTFNFYIKACDRLAKDPEKSKLIKAAWNYCCSSGQLSQPVLSIIKSTLSTLHLEELFRAAGTKDLRKIRVSDFPSDWSAGAVSGVKSAQSHQQSIMKKNKRNQRRHHRFKYK